jgi:hypothetical protein
MLAHTTNKNMVLDSELLLNYYLPVSYDLDDTFLNTYERTVLC